ncbi:unnamed protein product [Oncorhynchus mykiss]|uniref:Uncharacterized protein n=1 Tax=Oncorhynchus mykiss TaxID=8022 RepID=A0A060WQ09_ONCMY|nr:unnamed protein product [Oncorhynchus mykiss]
METLKKEADGLKSQIEAARKAVNDTTMAAVASGVAAAPRVQLKNRKTLKGHLAKIYGLHWSADNRREGLLVQIAESQDSVRDSLAHHRHPTTTTSQCDIGAYEQHREGLLCAG